MSFAKFWSIQKKKKQQWMLSNSGVSTEEALVDVTENHAALPQTPNFPSEISVYTYLLFIKCSVL